MYIKEMVSLKGISQQELANRMGVSLSAAKQMLSASSLTTNTLYKLAKALECEVYEFFIDPFKKDVSEINKNMTTCPHCGKPISIIITQ